MIRSFRGKDAKALFEGNCPNRFLSFRRQAERKLRILDAANELKDLRSPPGNQLEALRGDRSGQYSIRINRQWRICFEWKEGNAWNVEIVDYH
mgnify:CR=1 FL=1